MSDSFHPRKLITYARSLKRSSSIATGLGLKFIEDIVFLCLGGYIYICVCVMCVRIYMRMCMNVNVCIYAALNLC